MRYALLATLATAGTIAAGAASAMPLSNLSTTVQNDNGIEQVRLVCNRWGRCWHTGPRYYRSYGPDYGYYRPYGYHRPYGYYGSPGVGFSFRF